MVPLVTFQIFTWVTGSLYVKPAGWLTRLSASYAATFGAWPLATGSRVGSATAPLPPLAPVAVLSQPSDARTPASATASTAGTRGRSETGTSMAKVRSEEHTSELQSQSNLVCRLLLEKKKKSTHSRQMKMNT